MGSTGLEKYLAAFIGPRAFALEVDGPLTAPVWFHYLFKILTSAGIAVGLFCLTPLSFVSAALAGSVGFYLILKAAQAIFGDGDPATYTFMEHFGDDVTDCALAAVVLCFALFQVHWWLGLGMLSTDYLYFRYFNRYARPGGYSRS